MEKGTNEWWNVKKNEASKKCIYGQFLILFFRWSKMKCEIKIFIILNFSYFFNFLNFWIFLNPQCKGSVRSIPRHRTYGTRTSIVKLKHTWWTKNKKLKPKTKNRKWKIQFSHFISFANFYSVCYYFLSLICT